jgi:hypothetical protein
MHEVDGGFMRVTVVVAASAVVAALTGCSADAGIDARIVSRQTLQADITDRLAKAGDPAESVACQQDLIGQVGRTTRCDVAVSGANDFELMVTVTRVDGSTVDYGMSPALSQRQLEKAVTALVATNSGDRVDSVACESGLEGTVGATAYCDVDSGGKKERRTVRVTEVSGLTMNFNLTAK